VGEYQKSCKYLGIIYWGPVDEVTLNIQNYAPPRQVYGGRICDFDKSSHLDGSLYGSTA